jgi:hypothetical protein
MNHPSYGGAIVARGTDSATAPSDGATDNATAAPSNETPLSPEDQVKADAKKAARKARRAQRSYIVVPMPANLKQIFQDEANAADKPIGPFVRDFLAQSKGVEIPVTVSTRRVKYANDEERDNARRARRESRSSTMKNLMSEFRKLQASGLSPEEATARAAANVASGNLTPEPEPAAA